MSLFGTDGIRARVGTFPMSPDQVLRLGYATGRVLLSQGRQHGVLIAKDTRLSGYMFESALEAGLLASGMPVLLAGPLPTPAAAVLVQQLALDAAIVITASHNPYTDNGLKFFGAEGKKFGPEQEQQIEFECEGPLRTASVLGKAKRVEDAAELYLQWLNKRFKLDLSGLKVVVDAAHGAAYQVAPELLRRLGAEVVAMGVEPDGENINREHGATHPQALLAAVAKHRADFGLALDGDGDRLVMADEHGRLYDGDALLYALARHAQQQGTCSGVVGTVMTNQGVVQALERLGLSCHRAAVGDPFVLAALEQRGWWLGGENSGHLLLLDRASTGDGLLSALSVLEVLHSQQQSLAAWTSDIRWFSQKLINLKLPQRGFDWKNTSALQAIEQAERSLGEQGRVLVRGSGTEALLRVMVEADNETLCDAVLTTLVKQLEQGF